MWIFCMLCVLPAHTQTACTKHEVRTIDTIQATPEAIWSILTDFEKYPDWHPYLIKVEGDTVIGTMLHATYTKADGSTDQFKARMLTCNYAKKLSWGGGIGFLFSAEHYFIIEPIDAQTVLFKQGEYWRGLFGGMYGRKVYEDACVNFERMNTMLKHLTEQ